MKSEETENFDDIKRALKTKHNFDISVIKGNPFDRYCSPLNDVFSQRNSHDLHLLFDKFLTPQKMYSS